MLKKYYNSFYIVLYYITLHYKLASKYNKYYHGVKIVFYSIYICNLLCKDEIQ